MVMYPRPARHGVRGEDWGRLCAASMLELVLGYSIRYLILIGSWRRQPGGDMGLPT